MNNKTYTVKKGDTLYGISKQFNTSAQKIRELNNLKNTFFNKNTYYNLIIDNNANFILKDIMVIDENNNYELLSIDELEEYLKDM